MNEGAKVLRREARKLMDEAKQMMRLALRIEARDIKPRRIKRRKRRAKKVKG